MTFIASFEPQPLWQHFDAILTVPRPSKEEGKMRDYVLAAAERRGLAHRQDAVGNLLVRVPASPGREGRPAVVLQSHLDMVTEKNSDVVHDFAKDPIVPRQVGDYLYATGTTLGADNGIGVATMLALMEADGLEHGPLELLFTIDEETGLTGAQQLDPALLTGRRLLNLDSEEEGTVTVGCAGGVDTLLTLPLASEPAPAGAVAVELQLAGLLGGHSGMEIHLQRGNAIKLLARALFAVAHAPAPLPFALAAFAGGNKRNAIPREASATLAVAPGRREELLGAVQAEVAALQAEYRPADPGLRLDVKEAPLPERVWTAATAKTVLALLDGLPHGVLAMSYDIPGLVETSTNVAVVTERNGALEIQNSSRSSVASALAATRLRLHAFADLSGASAASSDGYPGWQPDLSSALLATVKRVHQRVLGTEPTVQAVHAGLECGLIGEKVPGMEMVSIGPQIESPHSPDERVKIPSVAEFWRFLTALLEEL
ncbi:MAG TPA: aminoacyl-histidine dipeptidase [Thermoanaerobaculia bacterium]|nr:aminoacyl-histidine dipeptidase [Thermoanaerobaculia bacterium]